MKKSIFMISMFCLLVSAQNVLAQCSVNGKEVPCGDMPVAPVIGFGLFFIIIMIVGFVSFIFWLWMFIDAARFEKENLVLWLLGMFFVGPIVSIVYYFTKKRTRIKKVLNDDINNNNNLDDFRNDLVEDNEKKESSGDESVK